MLLYLLKTFLLIGSTSFGGYMSLIAMVRDRMVSHDKIIKDTTLSEGIALSSFLPGPVAVNVVAYTGYVVAGYIGAAVSIIAVLMPSFLIVLLFSYLYFRFESAYDFNFLLEGVVPVVVAIIFFVCISMWKKNCTRVFQYVISVGCILTLFFVSGYGVVAVVLIVSGIIGMLINLRTSSPPEEVTIRARPTPLMGIVLFFLMVLVATYLMMDSPATKLFVVFSGVSLTLFGGGYVMVPILESLLVQQQAWLTPAEFAFGISIGQITPGPILISAAFFGYKVFGVFGAIISTIAIFLPSSILMIAASHFYQAVRNNRWLRSALTGVLPAVVGLIAFSGFSIFYQHVQHHSLYVAIGILIVSSILVFKFQINTILVLLSGVLMSILLQKIGL